MSDSFPVVVPSFVQNLLFGAGEIQMIEGGYNSDVILISHARQIVIKLIGGKKGISLSMETAVELGNQISRYRKLLLAYGLRVPSYLDFAVTQDQDNGQVYLFVVEPFSGYSPVRSLREDALPQRLNIAKKILDATEPILASSCDSAYTMVGLDPKTNNFVLTPDGGCAYIDFMPPRYRQDDGSFLVEYPNLTDSEQVDLWKWKYFTAEGLAAITLYQIGRICPEYFQDIKRMMFAWLAERKFYQPLHYLQFLTEASPAEIMVRENPCELRLLMCEFASRNFDAGHRAAVEDFFVRTHFEGFFPVETLNWARSHLASLSGTVQLQ